MPLRRPVGKSSVSAAGASEAELNGGLTCGYLKGASKCAENISDLNVEDFGP